MQTWGFFVSCWHVRVHMWFAALSFNKWLVGYLGKPKTGEVHILCCRVMYVEVHLHFNKL